jgi:hypothetical protein
MAQQAPIVFADAVISVSLANGVVRIVLGSVDAENKMQPTGTLVMPFSQFGGTLHNLVNAANGLIAKAREAQAKAGAAPEADGGGGEPESTKLTFPN